MAYISFAVGTKKDKSIPTFLALCDELGIKTLFPGTKSYNLVGLGNGHLLELSTRRKADYLSLKEDLSDKFSIQEMYPNTITTLENIRWRLFKAEDILERSFLVECQKCKRPLSIYTHFFPHCGGEVHTKLKVCPTCNNVYAPAYDFCPDCGGELQETEVEVSEYRNAEDFLAGIPRKDVDL